jgi:nicotinate-nucleotide adenylyltransferase
VRLGVYGGSFDPPHVGHLLVVTDAAEALGLDRVVWVPTATQPLKAGSVAAPADVRLAMVEAAVAGVPGFGASAIEIDRGGLSYTVDTLEAFAAAHPRAERFLLIGADSLATFDRWRAPERIVELAQVAVLQRAAESAARPAPLRPGMRAVTTRRVDLSSTEVRERVRAGKPIRGFVPEPVAAIIERAGLYR